MMKAVFNSIDRDKSSINYRLNLIRISR